MFQAGSVTPHRPSPGSIATAVWIECVRCGHWWLVPRRHSHDSARYVGPCCRD